MDHLHIYEKYVFIKKEKDDGELRTPRKVSMETVQYRVRFEGCVYNEVVLEKLLS